MKQERSIVLSSHIQEYKVSHILESKRKRTINFPLIQSLKQNWTHLLIRKLKNGDNLDEYHC